MEENFLLETISKTQNMISTVHNFLYVIFKLLMAYHKSNICILIIYINITIYAYNLFSNSCKKLQVIDFYVKLRTV